MPSNIERSTSKGVLVCNNFDYRTWCVPEKNGFTKENAVFEYQTPDLVVAREVKGNVVEKIQSIYRDQSKLNINTIDKNNYQRAYNSYQKYQTKTTSVTIRSLFLLIGIILTEIVLWSLSVFYRIDLFPPTEWIGYVLLIGIVGIIILAIMEIFVVFRSYQRTQRAIADLEVLDNVMSVPNA